VLFIESQFDPERTPAEIQRAFGETKEVSLRPMGLRAIFLSMAKKKEEPQGAA